MKMSAHAEPAFYFESPPSHRLNRSSWAAAKPTIEFGCFRVLPRRRQLVADGRPIELGTRAFDLLLILLEADGALVTKDELFSWVWPGTVVAGEESEGSDSCVA